MDARDELLRPLVSVFKKALGDFIVDIAGFPSVSVDILPISAFDKIDITLSEFSAFPDIMNIPGNHVKSMIKSMTFYDKACGTEMNYYLEQIGIGIMISRMSEMLNNLVGTITGDTTLDSFYALSAGVKFSKWEDKTTPVRYIKEKTVIFPKDPTVCNIVMSTCKTFEFGAIKTHYVA